MFFQIGFGGENRFLGAAVLRDQIADPVERGGILSRGVYQQQVGAVLFVLVEGIGTLIGYGSHMRQSRHIVQRSKGKKLACDLRRRRFPGFGGLTGSDIGAGRPACGLFFRQVGSFFEGYGNARG